MELIFKTKTFPIIFRFEVVVTSNSPSLSLVTFFCLEGKMF